MSCESCQQRFIRVFEDITHRFISLDRCETETNNLNLCNCYTGFFKFGKACRWNNCKTLVGSHVENHVESGHYGGNKAVPSISLFRPGHHAVSQASHFKSCLFLKRFLCKWCCICTSTHTARRCCRQEAIYREKYWRGKGCRERRHSCRSLFFFSGFISSTFRL